MSDQSHHGVETWRPASRGAYYSGCWVTQRMIPGGVIGDPVEDHLHALRMGGVDERLQVGLRPELGIDRAIILDAVGAAERALAVLRPDRVDRHQPQDIDAQRLQPRDFAGRGLERALRRELAGIDLIDDRLARPGRVRDSLEAGGRVGARLGDGGDRRGQQRQGDQGTQHRSSSSRRRRGGRARRWRQDRFRPRCTIQLPPTHSTAGWASQSGAVSSRIPPVGQKRIVAERARPAPSAPASPPAASAGKEFEAVEAEVEPAHDVAGVGDAGQERRRRLIARRARERLGQARARR